MHFLGIDPGLDGALALYGPSGGTLDVRDMPTVTLPKAGGSGKRREINVYALAVLLDEWSSLKLRAIIEQVGPTPQMGVTSAFSFGGSFWAARMACAAHFIPTEMVAPQRWKRALNVKGGADKTDAVRARASALLPQHCGFWTRAMDDGRAEASLIALYGAQQHQQRAA
jgi:Holliday junction resolvasome RuvABC endonuclease subunit